MGEDGHSEGQAMRIYIAGPMTNIPDLNFPLFHSEAARIRALGHEVVNPAEINSDKAAEWIDCMCADIKQLMTCDAVALLPGWMHSKGARIEHCIADARGMVVFVATEVVA